MSSDVTLSVADAPCLVFAYHELGYVCLEALLDLGAPVTALLTHADDPQEEIWWRSCPELARRHDIAVYFDVPMDSRLVAQIAQWRPAVIYSFNYRHLLSEEMLRYARIGAFNLHPSKLPAYRGRAPVNWVLVNGERETGVTLHHMVARADAGDIVGQRIVAIDDGDTALSLYRKLAPAAATLIREFHPRIVAGCAPRRAQNLTAGSYFSRRTPADGRFKWNWPARRIVNLVRAVTHPYPGAFCIIGGRKLYLWQATIAREEEIVGMPGGIVEWGEDGSVVVAAGTGCVRMMRLAWEGGGEDVAERVLRGEPLEGFDELK